MPQPLSSLKKHVHVSFGPFSENPHLQNPELALKALNVINLWATLETEVTGLFVDLVGDEPRKSATMYIAIKSDPVKNAVLKAIARQVFEHDQTKMQILEALLPVVKSAGKTRHKIAHWTWGYSNDLPGKVLLKNPTEKAKQDVVDAEHSTELSKFLKRAKENRFKKSDPPKHPKRSNEGILIFTAEDFDTARDDIVAALSLVTKFRLLIIIERMAAGRLTGKYGKLQDELCNEVGLYKSAGQKIPKAKG